MRLIKHLALAALLILITAGTSWAQTGTKISQFPSGSALTGAELVLGNQNANTVTFTANQIKTFVGSGLSAIPNLDLLANISGSSATPIGQTLSTYLDAALCNAQGDVIYRNSSTWVCLSPGTNGQVLATGGAGANPSWVSTGGTGTVTSVGTGTGLTGGPITTTGTISLGSISNNTLLANTSGGAAAPFSVGVSALLDSAISSTQGSILYRNATTWVNLAPGVSGQFLQTQGAAANPLWASAAGGGTVTSVTAGACLTATASNPITASGTILGTNPVNPQTGLTYTFSNGDQCKLVTFSNASPVAVTLPQAGGGGSFAAGWKVSVQNRNTGTVTITPTTSTIDGVATLTLTQNQGADIYSDGANYFTQRGQGSGGVVSITAGSGLTTTLGSTDGTITTSGTLSTVYQPQVKTANYTLVNSDSASLLILNSAGAATFTLPQAGAGGLFLNGWAACFQDIGAGTLTITPTTSTLDGGGSLNVPQNQGLCITSNGTNYFTLRGMGNGSTIGGPGTSTNNAIVLWNGITGLTIKDSAILIGTSGTNVPQLSGNNTWSKGQAVSPFALTDAASILVDATQSNSFTVTLAGNRALANPTGVIAGQFFEFSFLQDATGSRTLTYGANYKFPGGTAPTLTTTASAEDDMSCWARTTSILICQMINNVH